MGNQGKNGTGADRSKPVDMHVHVAGNGSGGTGCWVRLRSWQWPMTALMLRHLGLPWNALKGELDRLYLEVLLRQVRESSLGAVVILAQDRVYHDDGRVMEGVGTFYVPNQYVLRLGREHPELLPCVSIHPGRADAMEELERCLAGGAVMMKLLPNCQNVDCGHPRYKQFWERMAEAGMPLLAHTGGEHTVQVVRPELSDPRCLELPLKCGVTVIAAHCATKSGLMDRDYFPVFVEMTKKYPNLYGDISAFNVPIRGRQVPEVVREPLVSRMLHGSDFPVPVMGYWAYTRGFVGWHDWRRSSRIKNQLERDYQLKVAMGFPPKTFTRIWDLLPLPKAKEKQGVK